MSICQIEEREAGRSYPRTCPTCRLGPCSRGHDYKSMREQIATQASEIERLGEMTRKQAHEYLVLDMQATEALAEIERLARQRDHWQATHAAERLAPMTAEARATAAEAEAARLREELSLIAVMGDSHDPAVCSAIAYHAVKRARAALTERKP